MNVSLLIISHEEIASALLNAVKQALGGGELPLSAATVELEANVDPETMIPRLTKVVRALNQGKGVLILTDLIGSTPSNIARKVQDVLQEGPVSIHCPISIVTGVNVPMLMRVMNYSHLDLVSLAEKARTGGQCGIIECQCTDE